MQTSTITIDVHLDKDKVPEQINWKADSSSADEVQRAKAMMLAFGTEPTKVPCASIFGQKI